MKKTTQQLMLVVTWTHIAFGLTHAAVIPEKPYESDWFDSPNNFESSDELPLEDKVVLISPSKRNLRKRIIGHKTNPEIGVLRLKVKKDRIEKVVKKYAHPPFRAQWRAWLLTQLGNKKSTYVELEKRVIDWLNMDAFVELYSQKHHKLKLFPLENKQARHLAKSMRPFFRKKAYRKIKKLIRSKKTIDVDNNLLPKFARKAVRHYTVFQGPNCFHASLAFQNPRWTKFSTLNIKREKNHHKSMINHDELARALKQYFYPVQPPFKYGDLLVFADLPERLDQDLNYRWIKHAATWLFNGYVFSKGSKSPNTPWTVKSFEEEWQTWTKNTKKLGIKVFRRSQEHVKKDLPVDPVDWLY